MEKIKCEKNKKKKTILHKPNHFPRFIQTNPSRPYNSASANNVPHVDKTSSLAESGPKSEAERLRSAH